MSSRYIIQFYKQGAMKYISHLDLLRLFKRTFKRTGLHLVYSQGFNPHPKMSFAQPLSLGYAGEKEYLDFETIDHVDCQDIIRLLNKALPKGVAVTGCRLLPHSRQTLAAIVEYASYTVLLPAEGRKLSDIQSYIPDFLDQDEIIIEKKQKKTGKIISQNIRPMILGISAGDEIVNNYITLTLLICAGSNRNLNPEILLKAFCQKYGISFQPETAAITRNEMFYSKDGSDELVSIFEFQPPAGVSETGGRRSTERGFEENF